MLNYVLIVYFLNQIEEVKLYSSFEDAEEDGEARMEGRLPEEWDYGIYPVKRRNKSYGKR